MDFKGVPAPPAHFTKQQKEDYYLDHIRRAMEASDTLDNEGLSQHAAQDDRAVVDQPLLDKENPELSEVAQTVSDAEISKRTKVASAQPPPAPVSNPPTSSKASLPKEQATPPRPSSSRVHSTGSISRDSEARDVIHEFPSQGTHPGIYLQGTLSSSKSLTPKIPTT